MSCFSCGSPLVGDAGADEFDRYVCASCGAALVSYADIRAKYPRLMELLGTQRTVEPATPRDCPRCRQPMRVLVLFHVRLDLCARDGIWFDRGEEARLAESALAEGYVLGPLPDDE